MRPRGDVIPAETGPRHAACCTLHRHAGDHTPRTRPPGPHRDSTPRGVPQVAGHRASAAARCPAAHALHQHVATHQAHATAALCRLQPQGQPETAPVGPPAGRWGPTAPHHDHTHDAAGIDVARSRMLRRERIRIATAVSAAEHDRGHTLRGAAVPLLRLCRSCRRKPAQPETASLLVSGLQEACVPLFRFFGGSGKVCRVHARVRVEVFGL